jgi:hypothetical protein
VQSGNLPQLEPSNRGDLYSRLDLVWQGATFRAGARLEASENTEEQFTYRAVTARFGEWTEPRLRVRIGNFQTIVGRGLLHRSWELPGVVLDQVGIRSRYSFSRDMDGMLAQGDAGPVEVLAFAGRPNGGESSPAGEAFGIPRYSGTLGGGQIALALPRGARIGAGYTRASAAGGTRQNEAGTGFVELDPLRLLGIEEAVLVLYAEYAQRDRSFAEWWRFDRGDGVPHAFYSGANAVWGNVALAAEWKDYAQFRLGVNDPPSLVREHSALILNRNTHVLDAERETGFQIEGSWTLPGWGAVTVNQSRADGGGDRFDEIYVEAHVAPAAGRWDATLFYDTGQDEFVFVADREVVGATATVRATPLLSATLDAGRERSVPAVGPPAEELLWALTVSRAGWGDASVVWDRSPGESGGRFPSLVVSARLGERHDARLFVGRRRGGLACTGGTCYEVPALEGAEARITSRF